MNKLFDIVIIGAGTKGKRIAKKLATNHSVVIIDSQDPKLTNVTYIQKEVIYVSYVRGIIGVVLKGASSPEIFGQRLIIAAPTMQFLPSNFYKLDSVGNVIINDAGQLPAVKPLVYVANKVATNYNSKVESKLIETVVGGLQKC